MFWGWNKRCASEGRAVDFSGLCSCDLLCCKQGSTGQEKLQAKRRLTQQRMRSMPSAHLREKTAGREWNTVCTMWGCVVLWSGNNLVYFVNLNLIPQMVVIKNKNRLSRRMVMISAPKKGFDSDMSACEKTNEGNMMHTLKTSPEWRGKIGNKLCIKRAGKRWHC